MHDPEQIANSVGVLSNKGDTLEAAENGKTAWESARLYNEDREVFFACRKVWLQDDYRDSVEDFDEDTYDTNSIDPRDVIPYMVTMGYKQEKQRKEKSLVQILRIKELRQKYKLPPLSEEQWNPKWEFSCMSSEEVEENWPLHELGTDADGRVILWDKSGNLDTAWISKIVKDEKAKSALTFYCIRQIENIVRSKIALSKRTGVRMTKHVSVLDAHNIGLTNVTAVKDLMQRILADVQVMYPETLKKLYIINAGWLFKTAWMVIKNFLHPITAAKVTILGTNYQEALSAAGITEFPAWVI